MALSALDDKAADPEAALPEVLGRSLKTWQYLISRMESEYGPIAEEWTFAGAKWGWSCRLRRKKRAVLYLTPQKGSFLVGVVLGDRALEALRREDLRPATVTLIDEAPRYPEGTGVRIPVKSRKDCADVEIVVEAKMS